MSQTAQRSHALRNALFLDIPYIIDSVCRHADYLLNRLHRHPLDGSPVRRPYTALPAFALFVLVLLFTAYGATLGALCGVLGENSVSVLRRGAGYLCIAVAWIQFIGSVGFIHTRIAKRFKKQQIKDPGHWRRMAVYLVFSIVLFVWALPLYFFGRSFLKPLAFDRCQAGSQPVPAWTQLILFAVAVIVGACVTRRWQAVGTRVLAQAAILAIAMAILWNLPGVTTRTEAAQVPYPHLYAVIAVGFAAIACLANWLIHIPFGSIQESDRVAAQRALAERELFPDSRRDPDLSPRRIFGGCVIGVLQKPLQFLLLPAFAIILVPSHDIWLACAAGTIAAALLITASNLTSRWDQMSQYLRRYFLLGSPLIVSVAVIVLAILRLADVQYVATVLNVAPFGIIFVWTVMAYVLAWWFEYQVNSVLAAKLLWVLGASGRTDTEVISYKIGHFFVGPATRVYCEPRYLAAHATGQFVVLGALRENETDQDIEAFHTFEFIELFSALLGDRNPDAASEMGRRVQLYFALINTLLAVGFGILFWNLGRGDRINTVAPIVTAAQQSPQNGMDLAKWLHAASPGQPAAIVVAASGGGTRAALYTATVLQGLHSVGADRNIVLLSGVSGGGVAAAYFYGHRDALLSGATQPCETLDPAKSGNPWQCYLDRMAMPFIRDVLQGAGEWRVQSDAALGVLLAESLDRRLFADGKKTLGAHDGLGLILNTTISGHPLQDAALLAKSIIRPPRRSDEDCEVYERPVAALGGGRLAFSNLRDISAFAKESAEIVDIQMPFVVVRDPAVLLSQAAALTANFPPVFPNARVDLTGYPADAIGCTTHSYFVTDGGAMENLGLISALFALQGALRDPNLKPPLRDIEIVLADASATDYDYYQDRGVGAIAGKSKERLTDRLTLELLEQVREAARRIDSSAQIRVHNLALPRVFRSRGGFGTHWMFPEGVAVENPLETPRPLAWKRWVAEHSGLERYSITLDRKMLFSLWQALYQPSEPFCTHRWEVKDGPQVRVVADWICGLKAPGAVPTGPDPQPERWARLLQSVRATGSDALQGKP